MALQPQFASTPRISSVSIATSDSSYTSPTNFGTLITAAATGTRVAEIVVKGAATTTAAQIRVFLYDGSTYYLFDEIPLAAATGSATVAQARTSTTYTNLILPSNSWSLRVSTSVSQTTHVTALGADL